MMKKVLVVALLLSINLCSGLFAQSTKAQGINSLAGHQYGKG